MNPRSSIKEIIQTNRCSTTIRDFASTVEGEEAEHLWTLTSSGRTVRTKGDPEGVGTPELSDDELVIFEIHNHPNPTLTIHGFLHLSDIGAFFNGANRVFGCYSVLVTDPDEKPFLVACKFGPSEIEDLLDGDDRPYRELYEQIESIHGSDRRGRRFQERVRRCKNVRDFADLYAQTLPMLRFGVFEIKAQEIAPIYTT